MRDLFSMFVVDAAYKDVKNMQQFYDDKRPFKIAGRNSDVIYYDPEKFGDIEFDTEEFHALAGAFMDFLKRKKITDIVQLRDKYRENDLIWLRRVFPKGPFLYQLRERPRSPVSPI